MNKNKIVKEPKLEVYTDKSILFDTKRNKFVFAEGNVSSEAGNRLENVKKNLREGYLDKIISNMEENPEELPDISEEMLQNIKGLVKAVTSEVGRALVGLTVLQLSIKSIVPEQSIRLHKGSTGGKFSWSEGMPMRSLDREFITPVLRKHGLLRLNADGFMMTRSLAENYPYSKLYKAAIRGGRDYWLNIVELIERGDANSESALKHLISQLINRSEKFTNLANETLSFLQKYLRKSPSSSDILKIITDYTESTAYSARIFEIVLHSFMQALEEENILEDVLKPLSQMRSANKKHGNVGDIELIEHIDSLLVIEAWDAKYGKPYLRDELEEINDKLLKHSETKIAGFVTDSEPVLKKDVIERAEDISLKHDCEIHIYSFKNWISYQQKRYGLDMEKISKIWLLCFTESLCQKRRSKAPIDEPCDEWVGDLRNILEKKSK